MKALARIARVGICAALLLGAGCGAQTNRKVPAGATAECRDGSYSFSQHRNGTCSWHGGVSTWL